MGLFSRLIGDSATYVGPDQGIDFTGGPAPVYSLADAIVTHIQATGGWYNGGELVYRILSGPAAGRYVYTAENFSPDAGLQVGSRLRKGQQVGVATGTGAPGGTLAPGIETGFSQSADVNPYGNPTEGKGTNPPDPQAILFRNLVTGSRNRVFATASGAGPPTLAQLWMQAGGSPKVANLMAAIAMAESGGQAGATGGPNSDGSYDYGLWQINSSHASFNKDQLLNDPLYNARAAVSVYKSQGFTAWSTYNSGAYRQFLGSGGSTKYSITRPGGDPSGSGSGGSGSGGGGSSSNSGPSVSDILQANDDAVDRVPPLPDNGAQTVSIFGIPLLGWGLIKQMFSGGGGGAYAPTLGEIPYGGVKSLVDSIGGVTDFLKAIIWVFNVKNIARMAEFLLGIGLMAFGIHAMVQGRGEAAEGFSTGEAAISRSGLGRVARELGAAVVTKGKGGSGKIARPKTAPHRTRRTALRVRYEREQQVASRKTAARRA